MMLQYVCSEVIRFVSLHVDFLLHCNKAMNFNKCVVIFLGCSEAIKLIWIFFYLFRF